MNTYTIYNSEKIIQIIYCDEETLNLNIGEGETSVEGRFSDEFYYVKNNEIKEYPDKPDYPVVFNSQTEEWDRDDVSWWDAIRYERNNLLLQSDWTQVLDSPLSDSKKAEWATYRQNLRDLPADSDPSNISYPNKPE